MNEKYLKTKEGSIEDTVKLMQNKVLESDYQDKFKKALDKEGKPLGHMTGAEKKAFFGKVDKMHNAKNEDKEIPKGHHKMPDGTIMKDSEHKKEVKEENLKEADPITYGPDKVAKAMAIATKSDGQYSKAVREIEKIAKDLSKVSTIARALKTANEDRHAGAKAVYEQIKGLKNKAEKTGMPYGILKKVYDRGMAAWRGGHRPGTTQQQWAFARVNSFVTKSSGTWGGADKDLAKQVKG